MRLPHPRRQEMSATAGDQGGSPTAGLSRGRGEEARSPRQAHGPIVIALTDEIKRFVHNFERILEDPNQLRILILKMGNYQLFGWRG